MNEKLLIKNEINDKVNEINDNEIKNREKENNVNDIEMEENKDVHSVEGEVNMGVLRSEDEERVYRLQSELGNILNLPKFLYNVYEYYYIGGYYSILIGLLGGVMNLFLLGCFALGL